jgi:predicted permease
VQDENNRFFQAVARLNPNVTTAQAYAQLEPVIVRWAQEHPQTSRDHGLQLMRPHEAAMDDTSRQIIWFMFAVGVAVLLIACANIANLQLARATANARDLAIRSALGSSRIRLILHQLTECMLLALAGGVCGVVVAIWVNQVFGAAIQLGNSGSTLELPLNARILAGAFVASLFTGVAFGLLPAWFASRGNVVETLKQQTRGSSSSRAARFMRHALIVGEVAFALALLCAAGVMIRGLADLLAQDKHWDTDRVLFANIHLPEQSTYDTPEKRIAAADKLVRRLQQIPGAEATGICTVPPTFGFSKVNPIQIEGITSDDPNQQPVAGFTMIASDYLDAIGLPLLQGREFPADLKIESPGVVIINETMARHFWPDDSALGQRIGERQGDEVNWREVIGVVPDIEFALNIGAPPTQFQVYKPFVHEAWGYMNLVVRGQNPARFKNDLRLVVKDVDPDVAVQDMFTVAEAEDRFLHNLVTINHTIAGFAFLGLVLASVGLYGVISNLVAQRTPEFGIRLALGARPARVLQLVISTGARLTVIGLLIGGALAALAVYFLNLIMPRMTSLEPFTPVVIAVVLFTVAMFACWWPARRATRIDPLQALRAE